MSEFASLVTRVVSRFFFFFFFFFFFVLYRSDLLDELLRPLHVRQCIVTLINMLKHLKRTPTGTVVRGSIYCSVHRF